MRYYGSLLDLLDLSLSDRLSEIIAAPTAPTSVRDLARWMLADLQSESANDIRRTSRPYNGQL